MWKNIEKDTTEIVYDNKNLHITELEDTRPVFILFYLLVIKDNDPAVKIWLDRVRGNRQSFSQWPQGEVDFQTLVVRGQVNFNYWIEEFISNDFKLSLLHNCTNEESYFYLELCFHTRSSSAVRGDLIMFRERKHVLSMSEKCLFYSGIFLE